MLDGVHRDLLVKRMDGLERCVHDFKEHLDSAVGAMTRWGEVYRFLDRPKVRIRLNHLH